MKLALVVCAQIVQYEALHLRSLVQQLREEESLGEMRVETHAALGQILSSLDTIINAVPALYAEGIRS